MELYALRAFYVCSFLVGALVTFSSPAGHNVVYTWQLFAGLILVAFSIIGFARELPED